MSLLKLGSISTTLKSNDLPSFYLASVIHSQSGFMYPKMIYKVSDLDTFYGDFTYIDMYRDILNKNIPVLFIPTLTEESEYNRCSLRLSKSERYRVSHPSLNYEYLPELPHGLITNPEESINIFTYGVLLDFSKVDHINIDSSNYFILNGNCQDMLSTGDKYHGEWWNESDFMIWFRVNENHIAPVSRTDAKATRIIDCWNYINTNTGEILDKDSLILEVKEHINLFTSCTAYNIDDLLLNRVDDSDTESESYYLPNGILTTYFDDTPIEFSYDNYLEYLDSTGYTEEDYPYQKYLDVNSDEYVNELKTFMLSTEYDVVSRSILIREVERILREKIFIESSHSFDDIYDKFSTEWRNSPLREEVIHKLSVEYIREPGKKVNLFDLDNFVLEDLDHKLQDKLCSFTQTDRLIEFYSKVKGPIGKTIKINITKVGLEGKLYDIVISMGNYQEYYQIDLDLKNTINTTEDEEDYSEYKPLSYLNNSSIVDVVIYDFQVKTELDDIEEPQSDYPIRVQAKDADEYLSPEEMNKQWKIWSDNYDIDPETQESNPHKITELPEGEFYLDRYINETWDYRDEINTFKLLETYEYYPDLILVDVLRDYSLSQCKEILNNIKDVTDNIFSHALVQITPDFIYDYNGETDEYTLRPENNVKKDLVNTKSRMLYFYGNLYVNDVLYTTYYPYIINIIESDYIRRISDYIIYRIEDDVNDFLDKVGVNYILYNNLYYNYNRIKENGYDPNFIIRFNTSKISRVFMNSKDKLINCQDSDLNNLVSSLVDKCTSALPLVSYLSYNLDTDYKNTRTIELTVQIESVTNKKFILNINLNL